MQGKSLVPYDKRRLARRPPHELLHRLSLIGYLEEGEYLALLDIARHPEHRLILHILWETGIRVSELLSLRIDDVYQDGLNIMGKGSIQRFVPCQTSLLIEINGYYRSYPHSGKLILEKISTESGVLLMLRRLGKKAGINKRLYPHLFRHSFAINFLRQTSNPFALQEILGHSSMEHTKVYLRLAMAEMPREAIMKMRFPDAR